MTETTYKMRNKLMNRLSTFSQKKLLRLEYFLNQIDDINSSNDEILSFAGSLKDMDDDVFIDLTDKLHENRIAGKERIL
ncbi:MAG: hypothetical protein U9R19_13800 [Bacteroidota bacterium]|nr:hypothetical protein [Bacteroidota bacterium]